MRELKSFKICFNNRVLDYRQSEDLDLVEIRNFFGKKYQIKKLWKVPRHVLGILAKNNQKFFLKLSTSEGIGLITENEYNWNDYFNKYNLNSCFCAPKNFDSGLYDNKYFYLVTDYLKGDLLCNIGSSQADISKLIKYIPQIINLSEVIQSLPQTNFALLEYEEKDYKKRFLDKTKGWFEDIPANIIKKYKINELSEVVKKGISKLDSKPRHGDFTPWHMINLKNEKLGLIDGEHALPDGVENYDMCYLIQRIFSILKNPKLAESIYSILIKKYIKNNLKAVLASRAIGGFLDVTLNNETDYRFAVDFKNWVLSI